MNKTQKIMLGVLAVLVIGGIIWFAKKGPEGDSGVGGTPVVKYAEASDAADYLYQNWVKAVKDNAAQPDRATLAKSSVFTKDMSEQVSLALQTGTSDPVLCQIPAAPGITLRSVYAQAAKAEMLVTSKDKKVVNQAVVSLNKSKDTWVISGIQCTNGETAPVKEFNFEKEGYLLKTSIPKPFNNQNWHIVFTENGVAGNVAPLIFDAKSQCVSLEGAKAVCNPAQFKETTKVKVYGGMTERGATVVRLEFVK